MRTFNAPRILRFLRTSLIIASLSVAVFVFFFAIIECVVRFVLSGSSDPVMKLVLRGEAFPLVEHPRYVTDANGILVARPATPGTNEEGYRSPPIDEDPDGRKTVLLLGDSFTWGETAYPLSQSYADRIRDAGYKTINLGIPSTGPTQYEAQAGLYVPRLKPDAVCVFFYTYNDYIVEGPIRPGLARCYETEGGLFNATSGDGRQLSPEDLCAWNTYSHTPWMEPLASLLWHTVTGRILLVSASQPDLGREQVAFVYSQLDHIRATCEANHARFFLFLVPTVPSQSNDDNSVAFAQTTFNPLHPVAPDGLVEQDYRHPPDKHFNNAGHAKMARCVLEQLQAAGLEPHPGAGPGDTAINLVPPSPAMEDLINALALTGDSRDQAVELVRRMQLQVAGIYAREPVGGGLSPCMLLAKNEAPEPVVQDQSPVPGNTYAGLVKEVALEAFRQLYDVLGPDARRSLKRLPMERFVALRMQHDAVREKADALAGRPRKLTWEEFAQALWLSPSQAEQAKPLLNALKDGLAEVLSRPAEGNAPSPIENLASHMASAPGAAPDPRMLVEYMAAHREAVSRKPYMEVFGEKAAKDTAAFIALLTSPQQTAYGGLPIDSMMSVDTGHDPLGERCAAMAKAIVANGSGTAKGSTESPWDHLCNSLQLKPDQKASLKKIVDTLKDANVALLKQPPQGGGNSPIEVLRNAVRADPQSAFKRFQQYTAEHPVTASGEKYEETIKRAEINAREEARALMDAAQRERFDALKLGAMADLDTGHDPLKEALR